MEGTRVTSTPPPVVVGTTRWVSIRVRVRVPKKGFRPRRFTSWAPTLKLPRPTLLPAKKLEFCGSWETTSPTLVRLSRWISCSLITVTGLGVLKVERPAMREPVTITSLPEPAGAGAGVDAGGLAAPLSLWAKAGAAQVATARASTLTPVCKAAALARFARLRRAVELIMDASPRPWADGLMPTPPPSVDGHWV